MGKKKLQYIINNRLGEECMAYTRAVLSYFNVIEMNTCSSLYHYLANEPPTERTNQATT